MMPWCLLRLSYYIGRLGFLIYCSKLRKQYRFGWFCTACSSDCEFLFSIKFYDWCVLYMYVHAQGSLLCSTVYMYFCCCAFLRCKTKSEVEFLCFTVCGVVMWGLLSLCDPPTRTLASQMIRPALLLTQLQEYIHFVLVIFFWKK